MDSDMKTAIVFGLKFLFFTGREEVLNELGYTVRRSRRAENLTIKFSKDGVEVANIKTKSDRYAIEVLDGAPREFEGALFEFFAPEPKEASE